MKFSKLLLCILLFITCFCLNTKSIFAYSVNYHLVIVGDKSDRNAVHTYEYRIKDASYPGSDPSDGLYHNGVSSDGNEIDGLHISCEILSDEIAGFYYHTYTIEVLKDTVINSNLVSNNVDPNGHFSAISTYVSFDDGGVSTMPFRIMGDGTLTINMYSDNLKDCVNKFYAIGKDDTAIVIGSENKEANIVVNDCIDNSNGYQVDSYGIFCGDSYDEYSGLHIMNSNIEINTSRCGILSPFLCCYSSTLNLNGVKRYDYDVYQGIYTCTLQFTGNDLYFFKDSYVNIDSRKMTHNNLASGTEMDKFVRNAEFSAIAFSSENSIATPRVITEPDNLSIPNEGTIVFDNTVFNLRLNPYQYGIGEYGTQGVNGIIHFKNCDINIINDYVNDDAFENTPVFNIFTAYDDNSLYRLVAFENSNFDLSSPNSNLFTQNLYIKNNDVNSGFRMNTYYESSNSHSVYPVQNLNELHIIKPIDSPLEYSIYNCEEIKHIEPYDLHNGYSDFGNWNILFSMNNAYLVKEYKVEYFADDCRLIHGSLKTFTIPVNGERKIDLPLVNRDYNSFSGWYATPDYDERSYFAPGDSITFDTKLYAKFDPLEVTLRLNPNNGGEITNCVVTNYTDAFIGYKKPVKEGYTLSYWKDEQGNKVLDSNGSIHPNCPNIYLSDDRKWRSLDNSYTLTAVWEKSGGSEDKPSSNHSYRIPKTGFK